MKTRNSDLIDIWAARPDVFEFEPEDVKLTYRIYVEARIEELAGGPAGEVTITDDEETQDYERDLTDA